MQIRDNRLYRVEYGTFEEYCKEKWGMERRHAYRLIDGYKVTENVSHGTQSIPTSERAVRPLTRIKDPEEQREIYQRAVDTAPQGKVTAKLCPYSPATASGFAPVAFSGHDEGYNRAGRRDGAKEAILLSQTMQFVRM